ncbi:hypothetical protein [Variovorax sp. PBL-E5]|uniref:hypothetical protein n=1 Tax=Variovorax sp. PBL-E5 TaxID=434014 RepID=UPI0013A552BF|nr:hypothetical protein [Variovorax sp. PBL-E5]
MLIKNWLNARRSLLRVPPIALHPVNARSTWPSPGASSAEVRRIVDMAQRLKAASRAGGTLRPLSGKNLALLRTEAPTTETSELHRAGAELGARISHVRLGDPLESGDPKLRDICQMLGRLYDAVDCGPISSAVALEIERHAGIPVYHGLESDEHPFRILADLLCISERCPRGVAGNAISFLGNPRTPRGEDFVRAARLLGFDLRFVEFARYAANDEAFTIDASDAEHWAFEAPSGPIEEAERCENRHFVLQAMLLDAMTNR